jgi:hypothetical protein
MTQYALRISRGRVGTVPIFVLTKMGLSLLAYQTIFAFVLLGLVAGTAYAQNSDSDNYGYPYNRMRKIPASAEQSSDQPPARKKIRPRSEWTARSPSRTKNNTAITEAPLSPYSNQAGEDQPGTVPVFESTKMGLSPSSQKSDQSLLPILRNKGNDLAFRFQQLGNSFAQPEPIQDTIGQMGDSCGVGGCDISSGADLIAAGTAQPIGAYYPIDRANCPCFAANTGNIWARADYLLWWAKGSQGPPLVTTSPQGTSAADAGKLGRPGTEILFGADRLNDDMRSGGRFDVGYWLDYDHIFEISANYLFLGPSASSFTAASDGNPILARPYLNALTGFQDAELIAYPNVFEGSVSARAVNSVQGLGAMLKVGSFERAAGRFYFLFGYRYFLLNDDLRINNDLRINSFNEQGPITIARSDRFTTINEFNGADIGSTVHYHIDRFSADLLLKVAFGDVHSIVDINGATSTIRSGSTTVVDGGLLAQNSNMGRYSNHDFAMMPEFGATVGYDITSCLRATFGYTFIYLSKAARAPGQIDSTLNPSQFNGGALVGLAEPEFTLRHEDFWVHGMNFGLELRF